jgi:hypothetical protein
MPRDSYLEVWLQLIVLDEAERLSGRSVRDMLAFLVSLAGPDRIFACGIEGQRPPEAAIEDDFYPVQELLDRVMSAVHFEWGEFYFVQDIATTQVAVDPRATSRLVVRLVDDRDVFIQTDMAAIFPDLLSRFPNAERKMSAKSDLDEPF